MSAAKVGDVWYRYEHFACSDGDAVVQLTEHVVAKVTPSGVRLAIGKFINLNWHKRFAHPTKEEALDGFVARKWRQILILEAQLKSARKALSRAETGDFEPTFDLATFGEGLL